MQHLLISSALGLMKSGLINHDWCWITLSNMRHAKLYKCLFHLVGNEPFILGFVSGDRNLESLLPNWYLSLLFYLHWEGCISIEPGVLQRARSRIPRGEGQFSGERQTSEHTFRSPWVLQGAGREHRGKPQPSWGWGEQEKLPGRNHSGPVLMEDEGFTRGVHSLHLKNNNMEIVLVLICREACLGSLPYHLFAQLWVQP